jgi:hypothetical protein
MESKIIRLQSLLLSAQSSPLAGERPGEEDPFDALLDDLRLLPRQLQESDAPLSKLSERLRFLLIGMSCDPLAS